jgi:aldose 1-epimerase
MIVNVTNSGDSVGKQYLDKIGGRAVDRYTLSNPSGMTAQILTYGGIIQSLSAPDRAGRFRNVVLGFATLDEYVTDNSPAAGGGFYFGAIIGRYANRIAKGAFTLDDAAYRLPLNNDGNTLHGGDKGFDSQVWAASVLENEDGTPALRLEHVSPDGDMGFPGTLTAQVTYTLSADNRLRIDYRATTDQPTIVNLTNHTYWNLAGEDSGLIYDHQLYIDADHYTPVDATLIPTGEIASVYGTPLDFTAPTAIGARIGEAHEQLLYGQGYDLNWVLNRSGQGTGQEPSQDPDHAEPGDPRLAARAVHEASGRTLSVYTTEPGIQFYSGNFLTGTKVGAGGRAYRQSAGFALETQHFPDSPNQPGFPSCVLRPGQVYRSTTVYELSAL